MKEKKLEKKCKAVSEKEAKVEKLKLERFKLKSSELAVELKSEKNEVEVKSADDGDEDNCEQSDVTVLVPVENKFKVLSGNFDNDMNKVSLAVPNLKQLSPSPLA